MRAKPAGSKPGNQEAGPFPNPPPPSAAAASAAPRRGPRRSPRCPPLVAGQLEGQRVDPARDLPAPLRKPDATLAGTRRPRRADQRCLVEKELLEGEALPSGLGGVLIAAGSARRPARPPPRPAQLPAQAPRHGSSAWRASGIACQAHSRIRCGRSRSLAAWTGTMPVVWRPASDASRNSCSATLKPRFSNLPCRKSRVPGCSRSASQARLNQMAFACPSRLSHPPREWSAGAGASGESSPG